MRGEGRVGGIVQILNANVTESRGPRKEFGPKQVDTWGLQAIEMDGLGLEWAGACAVGIQESSLGL